MSHNTDYGTEYSYDMNSNITSLSRKGIADKEEITPPYARWIYGTIDSLNYTLNGNQLKRIDDSVFDPVYNGAFNFADGSSSDTEYLYDANGNMTRDMNKGITAIEYNYLNLPSCISYANGHVAEYVYDAAGTKRSVIYKVQPEAVFAPIESSDLSPATAEPLVVQSRRDYCDNHIYNAEGQLNQVLTDNGYIENDKYHFFIKDYQGNNRVVFDQDGTIEQLNHYYPYGGLFNEGNPISNQPYKFGGKELDRMNGLDLYDFGARMLDSATPTWSTPDPMAEKYYSISPYSYCGGNPISRIDPNGMDWVMARYNDESFYFYDSRIHSQNDVASNFGDDTEIAYAGESATVYTQNGKKGFNKYELNSDGSFSKNGKAQSSEYNNDGSLHIGSDKFTNNKTINANLYGSYLGPDNPSFNNAGDSYAVPPTNSLDYGAYLHDKRYDAKNAKGINGALLNTDVIGADAKLAAYSLWDSRTTFNLKRSMVASATSYLFINLTIWKSAMKGGKSIYNYINY